eukprot:2331279-Prymnesium_polylepis.1
MKSRVSHDGSPLARFCRSMSRQNSSKSMVELPSASTSSTIRRIMSSVGVSPSCRNMTPSSFRSTSPPPSRSNALKVASHSTPSSLVRRWEYRCCGTSLISSLVRSTTLTWTTDPEQTPRLPGGRGTTDAADLEGETAWTL